MSADQTSTVDMLTLEIGPSLERIGRWRWRLYARDADGVVEMARGFDCDKEQAMASASRALARAGSSLLRD